jgi:hypothetical protein
MLTLLTVSLNIIMDTDKEIAKKLLDLLAKKDASQEEKKVQALIKSAILSVNLSAFINEVEATRMGLGKIYTETVKGLVEYARAHNESQIRSLDVPDDKVEALVAQENIRLTEVEIWVLGTLAYFGVLEN